MTLGIDLLQSGLCLCFGSMCEQRNVIAFPLVWTEEKKNGSPVTTNSLRNIGCVSGGGGGESIVFNLGI